MASPPPGWYDDPARSGRLRYWDGAAWTEHLSDPLPIAGAAQGASPAAAMPAQATAEGDAPGLPGDMPAIHGASVARSYDEAARDQEPAALQEPSPASADSRGFWPFGDPEPTATRPLPQVQAPRGSTTGSAPEPTDPPAGHHHSEEGPFPVSADPRPDKAPGSAPHAAAREQHGVPGRERHVAARQHPSAPHPPTSAGPSVSAAGPRAADGALLAPWWRRLLAWVVDAALIVAVSILPWSLILATRIDQLEAYTRSLEAAAGGGTLPAAPDSLLGAVAACTVVTALLYFLYEVFGLSRVGTTVGRRLLGIRVRVLETPGQPTFEAASRRAAVKVAGQLAGGVPGLANLGLLFTFADLGRGVVDRRRRTLHDLAGATEVVLAPPVPASPQRALTQPPGADPSGHRSA